MNHQIDGPVLIVSKIEIEQESMGNTSSKVQDVEVVPGTAKEYFLPSPISDTPKETWKELARDRLTQMYLLFEGSQWHTFSLETDSNLLRTKLCYAIYGMPDKITDNLEEWYTEEQRKPVERIEAKILEAAGNPKKVLMIGFAHIVCKDNGDPFMVPVFRVFTGQNSELKDLSKYVDTNGRIYKDWNSWKANNRLPKVEYCYPKNGFYSCDETEYVFDAEKAPLLEFGESPACSLGSKAAGVTDVVSGVTSLASGAIVAASLITPVGASILAGTAIAGGVSAVYSTLRSANRLYDKGVHSESLKDLESIASWLAIIATPLNFASAATNGILVAGAESGRIFSDMQRMGATALIWTTIGANSAMIVTGFANLYDKKSKGQLNALDVAQFCMSVFFFTNTLIQPRTAAGVIKSAQEQHIESIGNSMPEEAAASLADFVNKNRANSNILENSKIIRTLNRMDSPGTFFGSLAGKEVTIGGRKGNTVLIPDANGELQRVNPNKFTEASKNNNVSNEFPTLKVNPQPINESNANVPEADKKKLSNLEMATSEKGRFQSIINKVVQYDRQIIDIAMYLMDRLDIKSSESFLTLVKIILSHAKGEFPHITPIKLNTMNGKVLEEFITGMKSDYETARKLAMEAALQFSDPWKAVYFYRKYGENFVKQMPSDVKFYLGNAARNLYKKEDLVPVDPIYGLQNAHTFHNEDHFGIVFTTSRGNPIVTTFKNEDLLKKYIDQLHRARTYGLKGNLSTSAAFHNLILQSGLNAIMIKFDYGNKLAESLDDFEDNEPDPEIQDFASEMLGAMGLDE